MWIGWIELDVLLGDVHSLKGKRAHVRPLVADLRRVFSVSAAEVDDHDLHRRAKVGVSLVAGDGGHIAAVLDSVERFVADRPELELGPRPPVPVRCECGVPAERGGDSARTAGSRRPTTSEATRGNAAASPGAAQDVSVVLTLYSSSFCGACAQTRRSLEDAAGLLGDRVTLREVNVAEDPDESERREIVATPTTVLTAPDGTELARAAGVPSTPQVLTLLARHL